MTAMISVRVEDDLKELGRRGSGWREARVERVGSRIDARRAWPRREEVVGPTSLSRRDRRQLAQLHRLASAVLDDDEREYHQRIVEVLGGFRAAVGLRRG